MQASLGDLSDRLSIAIRKRRIQAGSVCDEEVEDLCQSILEIFKQLKDGDQKELFKNICQLCDLNNSIWHLEFDIRTGKEKEIGLEVVGRRALEIREYNKHRVGIKSKMNDYSNTGYKIINV